MFSDFKFCCVFLDANARKKQKEKKIKWKLENTLKIKKSNDKKFSDVLMINL